MFKIFFVSCVLNIGVGLVLKVVRKVLIFLEYECSIFMILVFFMRLINGCILFMVSGLMSISWWLL